MTMGIANDVNPSSIRYAVPVMSGTTTASAPSGTGDPSGAGGNHSARSPVKRCS